VNAMVSFAGKSGHEMLAATNSGLFRTADPTLGWDRLSYGAGIDVRTTCISTSAQNPSVIFVGTRHLWRPGVRATQVKPGNNSAEFLIPHP